MDIYICPKCNQENGEHQKYCLNCGAWLLDSRFPAIKKEQTKKKTARFGFGSVVLVLIVIGAFWYFNNGGLPSNKIVFEKMELGDQFILTQMELNKGSGSVTTDLTSLKETSYPFELNAIFYDSNDQRLGRATTVVTQNLSVNQTLTLSLKFAESANFKNTSSVRVEINPLSPLQLLEKASDLITPKP